MATFISLPADIYHMIYGYLLVESTPISITSPKPINYKSLKRQEYQGRRSNPANSPVLKSFVALSRTNRAIRADVATIFFGQNTFIIGNGPHGSYDFSNLHAMRSLIRRLSSPKLSLIRRVIFCVSHGEWRVPSEQELEDLVSIAKIFVRNFTGVRRVLFENNRINLRRMEWEKESKMMATMAVKEVLKKEGLKEVGYCQDQTSIFGRLDALVKSELEGTERVVEVFTDEKAWISW